MRTATTTTDDLRDIYIGSSPVIESTGDPCQRFLPTCIERCSLPSQRY